MPVLGPREAAERLPALDPTSRTCSFASSAVGFSARPGLLPDLVRGRPTWYGGLSIVTTLHEYGW